MNERCKTCNKVIPAINLEFGGAAYDNDGDAYCNATCRHGYSAKMTRAYAPGGHLFSESAVEAFLKGHRRAAS